MADRGATDRIVGVDYDVTDESYRIRGQQRSGFEIDMGANTYISFDQLTCEWDGKQRLGETQWHEEIMRLQRQCRRTRC